jgi:hypothetical protein
VKASLSLPVTRHIDAANSIGAKRTTLGGEVIANSLQAMLLSYIALKFVNRQESATIEPITLAAL